MAGDVISLALREDRCRRPLYYIVVAIITWASVSSGPTFIAAILSSPWLARMKEERSRKKEFVINDAIYSRCLIAAFRLADLGYDVWLGNTRGNIYSRSHIYLDPDDAEFWQYSWVVLSFSRFTANGSKVIYEKPP